MLTSIADAILRQSHRSYWDAPDYFREKLPRSSSEIERVRAEERLRNMKQAGLW